MGITFVFLTNSAQLSIFKKLSTFNNSCIKMILPKSRLKKLNSNIRLSKLTLPRLVVELTVLFRNETDL